MADLLCMLLADIDRLIMGSLLSPFEFSALLDIEKLLHEVLHNVVGAETHLIGAAICRAQIIGEAARCTQFIPKAQVNGWYLNIDKALSDFTIMKAQGNYHAEGIQSITYSSKKKLTSIEFDGKKIALSANDYLGTFLANILELFNECVGCDNLVKRSLVLIKIWCNTESQKFWIKRKCYLTVFFISFLLVIYLLECFGFLFLYILQHLASYLTTIV